MMHFTPILALAGKTSTSVIDALPHLAGMFMVIATLTILWGVCSLTAKLVHNFIPESAASTAPAAEPAANSQLAEPAGIAPEIVAVIAAAVAASIGQSHRIISIKPMSTSWERAGRHSVLTSHRIR